MSVQSNKTQYNKPTELAVAAATGFASGSDSFHEIKTKVLLSM